MLSEVDEKQWNLAIECEINSLEENRTWETPALQESKDTQISLRLRKVFMDSNKPQDCGTKLWIVLCSVSSILGVNLIHVYMYQWINIVRAMSHL